MDFSTWLISVLEQSNISQAELARRMGISRQAINNLIGGRSKASIETYKNLARAIGIPTDEVLRAAGVLKPITPKDALRRRIEAKLEEASEEDLETLDRIAGTILDRHKRPKAVGIRAEME